MDSTGIGILFAGSTLLAVLSFVGHGRWAGTGERAGCISMLAFVLGWLCVLTALLSGGFLLLHR